MPDVDPELAALIAALPVRPRLPTAWPVADQSEGEWLADVARQREACEALSAPSQPLPVVGSVADEVAEHVPVRVYRPIGDGPHPAVVVLHGGGFWIGGGPVGLAAADGGCRLLCALLGAVVVNVDYRQAPEWRFPTAHEDAWTATSWTARLDDVEPHRVAVNGASAGANLAAGVARLSRSRGPSLVLQQLLVPTLDATLSSPSAAAAVGEGLESRELSGADLVGCWDYYLGLEGDRTDPLVSPLLAEDLRGLPPAHIVVGEHDPLRDDGLGYAHRLHEAEVPVRLDRYRMTHGLATPAVGTAYLTSVVDELRRALAP